MFQGDSPYTTLPFAVSAAGKTYDLYQLHEIDSFQLDVAATIDDPVQTHYWDESTVSWSLNLSGQWTPGILYGSWIWDDAAGINLPGGWKQLLHPPKRTF